MMQKQQCLSSSSTVQSNERCITQQKPQREGQHRYVSSVPSKYEQQIHCWERHKSMLTTCTASSQSLLQYWTKVGQSTRHTCPRWTQRCWAGCTMPPPLHALRPSDCLSGASIPTHGSKDLSEHTATYILLRASYTSQSIHLLSLIISTGVAVDLLLPLCTAYWSMSSQCRKTFGFIWVHL